MRRFVERRYAQEWSQECRDAAVAAVAIVVAVAWQLIAQAEEPTAPRTPTTPVPHQEPQT